jgi:hypothetical protein
MSGPHSISVYDTNEIGQQPTVQSAVDHCAARLLIGSDGRRHLRRRFAVRHLQAYRYREHVEPNVHQLHGCKNIVDKEKNASRRVFIPHRVDTRMGKRETVSPETGSFPPAVIAALRRSAARPCDSTHNPPRQHPCTAHATANNNKNNTSTGP